jgi:hypothetical protein
LGKRFKNWMAKLANPQTRNIHQRNWRRFTRWSVTAIDPLTDQPYFTCLPDDVDDLIRHDFETMSTALFVDKYRDVLTKYLSSISHHKNNTINAYLGSVKSFFSSETTTIKLAKGKTPSIEPSRGDHELTVEQLQAMWQVGNFEEKARVSTALSLGWSISDFLSLTVADIRAYLKDIDDDGFVAFDGSRIKTRKRGVIVVGVLNRDATRDLIKYLEVIPEEQKRLWSIRSAKGMNLWLKQLYLKGGLTTNRRLRWHCFRKLVFSTISFNVGFYEAKLVTGKKVRDSEVTYLQGLKQRVLTKYKEDIYPLLQLRPIISPQGQNLQVQVQQLKSIVQEQQTTIKTLQRHNVTHEQQFINLLNFELTKQKLDLLTLDQLTDAATDKEARHALRLSLEANIMELEEIQRQLQDTHALKT